MKLRGLVDYIRSRSQYRRVSGHSLREFYEVPVPLLDKLARSEVRMDVDQLGFNDLLDVADALLRRYPPDTIVCSHNPQADVGARTTAAIADLIESCRLAGTSSARNA